MKLAQFIKQSNFIFVVLFFTILACATNTPAAVAPPQPTRTPFPTFTITPVPPTPAPTPTFTDTPLATDTPPPTETPTPAPPTDTPVPSTNTPVPPTNTSVPPTNTPLPPTSTPTPVAASVLPTPTNTPEPGTLPGEYEEDDTDFDQNCAHVGLTGRVYQQNGEAPIEYVTVQVTGDEDPYRGPYTAKTNADGEYTILIGELNNDIDGVEFEAIITGGPGVKSLDEVDWTVSSDCDDEDAIQIFIINWQRKN